MPRSAERFEGRADFFSEPLNAALPGRQTGQATKAVTGHRTPKTELFRGESISPAHGVELGFGARSHLDSALDALHGLCRGVH